MKNFFCALQRKEFLLDIISTFFNISKFPSILALCALVLFFGHCHWQQNENQALSHKASSSLHQVSIIAIHCKQKYKPKADDTKPQWQQSSTASVLLQIRDKIPAFNEYDAVFFVITPHKEKQQCKIHVTGTRRGHVAYPDDFSTGFEYVGKYIWYCKVRGQRVINGTFEYRLLKNGTQSVTVLNTP